MTGAAEWKQDGLEGAHREDGALRLLPYEHGEEEEREGGAVDVDDRHAPVRGRVGVEERVVDEATLKAE